MPALTRIRGFLPYVAMLFFNAFVDLGHKIIIQNSVFKSFDGSTQIVLTAIVNALILLPFILLFTPSGFISDRFAKHRVMQLSAWAVVGLTLAITACYYAGLFWPAFAMTFLLAVQSAIYSPAKYGFIKALVGKEQLAQANGVVQAMTMVAILGGIFAFSVLFEARLSGLALEDPNQIMHAIAPIGWMLVAVACLELAMAYRLPAADAPDPALKLDIPSYLKGRELWKNLAPIRANSTIRLSIIGLSVFWAISQVMLASFPAFAKEHLAIDNTVLIQGMLAASGIGIMIGSLIAGRASKQHIELGVIPLGSLGILLGLTWMTGLESVLAHSLNFLFIGIMGGLFVVPLNALIQFHAPEHQMGKVLAGNNLIQNLWMLGFLLLTVLSSLAGADATWLIGALAVVALIGCGYTLMKLPQSLVRFMLARLLRQRYRLQVQGFEHIPETGGVLMLGNHISWIDWALVQLAMPRPVRFVMHRDIYQRWYLKWFFDLFGVIPIAGGASRSALSEISASLARGEVVCLFPEGTISRNGQLAEFKSGYERAIANCPNARILPFYLRGLWGSQFSRSSQRLKTLRKPRGQRDIIVAFGAPLPHDTRADQLKQRIFDLSLSAWQSHADSFEPLPRAWIDSVKRAPGALCMADSLGVELSAAQALTAAHLIGKRIRRQVPGSVVGLLLPTSCGGVLGNMAALLAGKTLVNLNYTASVDALRSALEQAGIRQVVTSARFLGKLSQRGLDVDRVLEGIERIELESLRAGIGRHAQLLTWLAVRLLPSTLLNLLMAPRTELEDTAAILFSSGSEGAPKGVMLSHRNIMANLKQISDVLNTRDDDVVLASLPLFHAFGLTVTQFMPLIEGMPLIAHPDPTDVVKLAKLTAQYRVTLMCATATFLRLYTKNRKVHPLMLDSLRVVVAGAEKLSPEVRDAFKLKFNKEIYEGYGATETTPVASVNVPDHLDLNYWQAQQGSQPGTVGMPLPGTSFKVVDPDSLEELPTGEAGLVLIGGAQLMQGYLNSPEKTDAVIVERDGLRWYKSGDKGRLDAQGFLTIVDRYSRFAKLGGEMISLGAIEEAARKQLADDTQELVAINLPDEKKGERIVLLLSGEVDTDRLRQQLLQATGNPLMVPAEIRQVAAIPKLGSGKTDYQSARQLALA